MKSVVICFEGIEGSGKTTQSVALQRELEDSGIKVKRFAEPYSTPLSLSLRDVILNNNDVDVMAEYLLFLASRAHSYRDNIKPAIEEGCVVLLDRFSASSLAYQGQTLDREVIRRLESAAIPDCVDYVFLFDVSPVIALERVSIRGRKDKFEARGLQFHTDVRNAYLDMAKAAPRFKPEMKKQPPWLVFNASMTVDELKNAVLTEFNNVYR